MIMGCFRRWRLERMEAGMSQSIECPNCRCEVPVALFASRIGKVRSEAKAKASIRSIAATAEARIAALKAEAGKLPDVNAAFAGAGW